jgi:protein SCO1/2
MFRNFITTSSSAVKQLSIPRIRTTVGRCNRMFSGKAEEKANMRGPVTFASLAVFGIAGGVAYVYYNIEKEEKIKQVSKQVVTVGKPSLGGPWVLVDQDGIPRTDASYRGQFTLLYFGFTHCPDICPSELVKVGKIMDELEKKKTAKVLPLFISVDPSRDTIGQLRFYGQDFHKDFVYLTGTKDQVAAAAKAYRVYFSKVNNLIYFLGYTVR